MSVTLRTTEIAGPTDRLRIAVEGQRGAPLGSIRVTEVSGRTRDASVQPWQFPTIEDSATTATISGTSTRTYPEGFGVGWGQPPKAVTTATCAWSFTRGGVDQSSANTPTGGANTSTGGRGRAPIAGAVAATPSQPTLASGSRPITTTPGASASSSAPPEDSRFVGTAGVNGTTIKIYPVATHVTGSCDFVASSYSWSCRIQWVQPLGAIGYVVTHERNLCEEPRTYSNERFGVGPTYECLTWKTTSRTDHTVGMVAFATLSVPADSFYGDPADPWIRTEFYVTATYPNGGQSVPVKWCLPSWETQC
jgi:hypothetical protein